MLATAAPADAEYARRLGARDTIDHTSADTAEQARRLEPGGVDVVVDLADGLLTVEIAATYPFPEAPTAMADFAAGKHTRGKVVITLAT